MSIRKKGQLFSIEFLLAITIFAGIVVLGLTMHDEQLKKSVEQVEEHLINQKAFQTADFLIRTPGYPENWDQNTVKLVGLASSDHILQSDKISKLDLISYETLKSKLKIFPNEFYLEINSTIYNYSKGQIWDESSQYIIVEERATLINTSSSLGRATLRLFIWN